MDHLHSVQSYTQPANMFVYKQHLPNHSVQRKLKKLLRYRVSVEHNNVGYDLVTNHYIL
jgi:hypothetical protein